jgi:triacylglycerol lipase
MLTLPNKSVICIASMTPIAAASSVRRRGTSKLTRAVCAAACITLVVLAAPGAAAAKRGPALAAPVPAMKSALKCSGELKGATRDPVLLVHGTFADSTINWSWNYQEFLPGRGQIACAVDLPERGAGDIQFATQYVVYAIRSISQASGRKVAIIGHSQGGLEPRWALRWWPDLRRLVSDIVSFGSPHHGTLFTDTRCIKPGSCAASLYQMRSDSAFLRALNRGRETVSGVPFTSVWSATDQFVTPQRPAATLRGASNVGVQQICPGRYVDHASLAFDAVSFAIAVDAIDHVGPAKLSRIDRSICRQDTMPGVTRPEANAVLQQYIPELLKALKPGGPRAKAEPRLACYVRGRCGRR